MIRVRQLSTRLSNTLTKACKMLRIKENVTWYSARGSFISKMVDAGNNPYVVAEMAGFCRTSGITELMPPSKGSYDKRGLDTRHSPKI